jgi:serine protease Do
LDQKHTIYEKEFKINPKTKIKEKQPDQKYIYLTNTALDIKKDSLYVENYTHKQFKKNKKTKKVEFSEKEIESSNTIFSNTLNDILKDYGYIDTVQSTLKSRTNSLYIDAKISKIKFKRIRARFHHNAFGNCEIHMEWRLMDVYDQVKFAKTLTVSSGNFASNHNLHGLPSQSKDDPTTYIGKSLQNAITTSFFHFLSLPDVSKILKKDETPIVNYEQLTWKAKQQTQTLKNARNASVSISVDKGHGSGVLISDDGYVITNYHVVAGQSTSEVILNTGEKLKATLIRWSEDDDIALLKIDDTSKRFAFFALPKENNFDLGDEVFAIGTPHSIELSQTLTKGIISGFRKRADNTELIQTDVSVSPGNSGGGLVTPSGQLLGIVGSKIVGRGVEGISFCIPAYQLEKILKLNIEYQ